jgi:hypothetical protein
MPEPIEISLTQLVLWRDAARIQSWPELLARIPDETVLRSPTDFGRLFETERMTDKRHSAAERITRNLSGLESNRGQILLRGVGLLERKTGGYGLSEDGLLLAGSYRDNRYGKGWVVQLARLLLCREPRTRVIMSELSRESAVLRFERDSWFGGNLARAKIEVGADFVEPFADVSHEGETLRGLLERHSWWSLGRWRDDPLLAGQDDCRFTGQLKKEFSLTEVGSAVRASFEVLLHLGVLDEAGGECRLNMGVARRELGEDLAEDFAWEGQGEVVPLPEILGRKIKELRSDTGYVVASELRRELRALGIENPDREIARLEEAGAIVIEAEDFGQSRHGEGLFGDARKQLVKIRVLGGGHPAGE